ncbi:MAG: HIT family protein [Nanoarchaeota archaeon]|nr:HIT family protein [Nanoarchaeota archaeon]
MNDCLFCKIINKELPSDVIYEDDQCLAILNIHPVTEGHTLVIPKKHSENIFDVDQQTLQHIIVVVKKVAQGLKESLHVGGINIGINNGKPGQDIFHLHFHLMPRTPNDGLKLWDGKDVNKETLKKTAEKIRKAF